MTRRQERVSELIRSVMSDILLREARDPRFGFLTVTEVKISADLRDATIFVSVLGEHEQAEDALRALKGATGYIRCELAKRAGLRVVPVLNFRLDPSAEHSARVLELLEKIRREEQTESATSGSGSESSETAE